MYYKTMQINTDRNLYTTKKYLEENLFYVMIIINAELSKSCNNV